MFVVWFIFEHYIPKCKLVYRFCITFNVYKFCLFFIEFYFQSFAQSLIFTRSRVSISALVSGFVRPNDILVSSANSLMMDSILCPMSLMNIKNKRRPRTDP